MAASFVRVSARAGEVALRIGLNRELTAGRHPRSDVLALDVNDSDGEIDQETREIGMVQVRDCFGMGGTLESIGQVIESCLSTEILKAKYVLHLLFLFLLLLTIIRCRNHLKDALAFASLSQDNHLRALILALISSHYFHTAGEQAQTILGTCEQLAAGLGAASIKRRKEANGEMTKANENGERDKVGNAPLRLWVGERFLGAIIFISIIER